MSNLTERITDIHAKLVVVIENNDVVAKENVELKDTIVRLTKEISEKEGAIASFKSKLEEAESAVDVDFKKEHIQNKLDAFGEEIDACIELTNEWVS